MQQSGLPSWALVGTASLQPVSNFTAALAKRGVRVLWPYLTWDTGTRREGVSDEVAVTSLLRQTGGAGINGDSIPYVPESFWNESLREHHPLALQAEGGARDEALKWSTLGWGYWGRADHPDDPAGYNWTYKTVPLVDRFKFITHGRFMTQICERYAKNKTDDLQFAWFNGDGYVTWENVWGSWNVRGTLLPRPSLPPLGVVSQTSTPAPSCSRRRDSCRVMLRRSVVSRQCSVTGALGASSTRRTGNRTRAGLRRLVSMRVDGLLGAQGPFGPL